MNQKMENNDSEQAENKLDRIKEDVKNFKDSPWVFLIRRNKLTYLIIFFLIIFGISTIRNLPRELQPEVEIPIAVVSTAYPGASPVDVEEQITKEIENQVSDLEGLKNLDSTSSLGFSSVVVEFGADQDIKESIDNLESEVGKVKNDLPDDASDPQVMEISLEDQAIFTAAISGDNYDPVQLKEFAEDIKKDLASISQVSEVKVVGGKERIIEVEVDKGKLNNQGISFGELTRNISSQNMNLPLGSMEVGDYNYTVRTSGKFESAQEIGKLQISSNQGKPILLEDVARVEEGFSEESSRSRLSVNGNNPQQSVSLQLFKKTGGDITAVAAEARERVENGRGGIYPEDVNVEVTADFSEYISESINTLSINGLQTVLIILILLFIFLGWREALIAGLAVPFSFFISFIMMSIIGESLNFLSLFSLVLALGLLVDSAIVIVEGMYSKVSNFTVTGFEAAVSTIKEYAPPLLAGMLTTVAAFFPLMFIEGIIGEFMKTIPIVVITTLIAALFVSLTIVPAIGILFINPHNRREDENGEEKGKIKKVGKKISKRCRSRARSERWASRIFDNLARRYKRFLPTLLENKFKRRFLMIFVWFLFFVSLSLPITGVLKIKSFGEIDGEYFYVNLSMPNGTVLEKTDEEIKKIEEILLQEPEVTNFVSSTGSTFEASLGSMGSASGHKASVQVNLTDTDEREIKSGEIVSGVREKIEERVTGGDISIVEEQSGPPSGSPIELRVVGEDLVVLEELSENIKERLADIPTVINEDTSVQESPGEFVFFPNKDLLTNKGLSVATVSSELREGIAGNNDIKITKNGEELNLNIKYKDESVNSSNELENIAIKTPGGEMVPVSALGKVEINSSLAQINRKDEERVVTITANTDGGNPTEITQKLREDLRDFNIPAGYRIDYGGEQEELMDTYQDMLLKMFIGIILILFILVALFNSFKQVLLILFTIPLAMIGVFFGMAAVGLTLDIPAFVGVVSLVGIVVNNAIILIDQINRELAGGRRLVNAVQEAGFVRLRPIILTTITTIFGLLPLSITQPDWRNMGFSIIFGLTFSAFLTLFIIPVTFVSFYKKRLK
ncbi:MAG: efflux RND transporter permease subunit [Candidatus Moraniibacteriota bacterium]